MLADLMSQLLSGCDVRLSTFLNTGSQGLLQEHVDRKTSGGTFSCLMNSVGVILKGKKKKGCVKVHPKGNAERKC